MPQYTDEQNQALADSLAAASVLSVEDNVYFFLTQRTAEWVKDHKDLADASLRSLVAPDWTFNPARQGVISADETLAMTVISFNDSHTRDSVLAVFRKAYRHAQYEERKARAAA